MRTNILDAIYDCFDSVGVDAPSRDDLYAPLTEKIESSLMYITLIVELEDTFNIEIPDEYLDASKIETVMDVYTLVCDLVDGISVI